MSDPACPSREEIAAYLASALDDASADRFASHVEDCQACQAALGLLRAWTGADPPRR
jgi:anti-sigma factor RsiW